MIIVGGEQKKKKDDDDDEIESKERESARKKKKERVRRGEGVWCVVVGGCGHHRTEGCTRRAAGHIFPYGR